MNSNEQSIENFFLIHQFITIQDVNEQTNDNIFCDYNACHQKYLRILKKKIICQIWITCENDNDIFKKIFCFFDISRSIHKNFI